MKTIILLGAALLGSLSVTIAAEPQTAPKMKMTTEIPPQITTPDSVETRLGTLKFFDGFPDDATVEKVLNNLDFSRQTRSELQTDQQFPSIGSQKKGIVVNPDTSVDVYFAPTAPAGHEDNWVQTIPGKGWNVILRLYGPLQPWFDKTWRPNETELVK